MSTTTITCPVCGAEPKMLKEQSTVDCTSCSTPSAFTVYFASAEAYQSWLADMRSRKEVLQTQKLRQLRSNGSLVVGPEHLAFHDAEAARLVVFNQYGRPSMETNVQQYSVSNLHQVTLKTTGTLSASGDNGSQQCQLTGRRKIKAVLAAPRCTYMVNGDGTVSNQGICEFRNEIAGWRNIKSLACGKNHVVGLTENGTVVQASNRIDGQDTQGTKDWRNIKAIAAAFNYTLGLHENGTVSYAGPKADMAKEIAGWKNIAAIAADSQYAIGLTEEGQVLLAGSCNSVLDGGRSQAREWKDIVCIGAGHSVIAGLTADGDLLLAGWCMYRDAVIAGFRSQNPLVL